MNEVCEENIIQIMPKPCKLTRSVHMCVYADMYNNIRDTNTTLKDAYIRTFGAQYNIKTHFYSAQDLINTLELIETLFEYSVPEDPEADPLITQDRKNKLIKEYNVLSKNKLIISEPIK